MSEVDTLPDADTRVTPKLAKPSLILTVVWAPEEGRWLGTSLLPLRDATSTFGRGDASTGGARLRLIGMRPGAPYRPDPPTNNRLSRNQIQITPLSDRSLRIENVGLCPLLFDGREQTSCELNLGDIFVLGNRMAFLCHQRLLPGRQPLSHEHPFGEGDRNGIVGESEASWILRRDIDFAAERAEHTLILGASGSGKELVANAIHRGSAQSKRPLVSRNAATIPETLIDAELFGNVKNYPNPGTPERPGLIGQAHLSTLFLDEFAELPQPLQAHLLRVLDAGEYQRLGDADARTARFRLVAATNRPLESLKEDVAARFLMKIRVPDLNERREDIPLLVRHILRQIGLRDRSAVEQFFPENNLTGEPLLSRTLMLALMTRTYRTHARELMALLWESIRCSTGNQLELPPSTTLPPAAPMPSSPRKEDDNSAEQEAEQLSLTSEKLQRVLDENNGSVEKSWRTLGLSSRYVLRRLIQKYQLQIRKQSGKR